MSSINMMELDFDLTLYNWKLNPTHKFIKSTLKLNNVTVL